MGNWGVGLLENNVAVDVHRQFEEYLFQGHDLDEATALVLANPPWPLDDRSATYLALVACQLQHQHILPETKEVVLRVITSGEALAQWEGAAPERVAARQIVLDHLVATLTT